MDDNATHPPMPEPKNSNDAWENGSFPSEYHRDAYCRSMDVQAKNILKQLEQQNASAKATPPVYSLDECMERIKYGPFDFTTILGTNAQILNDFFEQQLKHARETTQPGAAINSALRAQGQLVRTLNTLVRYENFQNGETK